MDTATSCWSRHWDWNGWAATSALTLNSELLKVLEKCLSEVRSDKAVDDEVDRAVEHDKVSDDVVCNPPRGGNVIHAAISEAVKNVWNCWNLPTVIFSFNIHGGIWILNLEKDYFGLWCNRFRIFMGWKLFTSLQFTSYRAIIIFGKCRMINTITMAIMILASVKSMLCWLDPFNLCELQMILMFRTMMARRGRKQVVVVGWNIFE